jgi:S1-C subfamily serine protease
MSVVAGLLVGLLLGAGQAGAQAFEPTDAAALRRVLPAVVTLSLRGEDQRLDLPETQSSGGELLLDLFGDRLSEPRRIPVASGVIVDVRGLVVTAAHAVEDNEDELEASTSGGAVYKVAVVGVDRKTDVAVLRLIGAGPFPHAAFGDSSAIGVGTPVFAVGTPFGLGSTVTAVIISATPRVRPAAFVDELIQTDAATFPDSAGGPLLNARGEVIGLLTVLTQYDFGIGFALPSNVASRIVGRLARDGEVRRGTLDVRVQRLTPGLSRALVLPEPTGLVVTDVASRAEVAKLGLLVGDVLTRIDNVALSAPYDLERALRDSEPGQKVELAYWRKGRASTARVVLVATTQKSVRRPFASRSAALLRFEVRPITPELGVVVELARPDGTNEPGVHAGDVIRAINQQPVRTVAEFERAVEHVRPGEWIALLVQRGRVPVLVGVKAGDRSF